ETGLPRFRLYPAAHKSSPRCHLCCYSRLFAKQAQNPKIQSTDNQRLLLSVFAPTAEIRLWRRISKKLDLIIRQLRNPGLRLFGGRVFLGRSISCNTKIVVHGQSRQKAF
ncbi:MAG: hypothetical protein IKI66_10040, partial [Bacteroidales bacterium]|nr:hypothetical protein [Bacteroidales bacterium]